VPSPPSDDRPQFWIFAGPNGSGKSTAYSHIDTQRSGNAFWIVNPDLLAARIRESENLGLEAANMEAVKRLERWLEATIDVHRSVGVETVLSTSKYQRLVTLARQRGFRVSLRYFILSSPQLNVDRVRARVAGGGHDVPEGKIVDRYWRSLAQLPWFLDAADTAEIYDNSSAVPRSVGRKVDGALFLAPDAPENLLTALAGC
jgi:predicted ABC-type ATPase